ncbi:hypothetical protein AAF712_008571 [Marasmius tenuissimus]|uniref:Uncharacterized protein n=1 Tax=Marasmius tenuissimus TaxID=585030 RepID=A0ABR2ZT17_9AGAR
MSAASLTTSLVSNRACSTCLSYKSKLVKNEMYTVFLGSDGAFHTRDELAKSHYSFPFSWLNEYINQRLCKDDFRTFLALFALPPQLPRTVLHQLRQRMLFESHLPEYQSKGIANYLPQVTYLDNTECLRLLQNKPGGLVHIIDDQAKRAPKKTNYTMNFELNSDFVSLLRGGARAVGVGSSGEASGSINPFVKDVISGKAIAMGPPSKRRDDRRCSAECQAYASSFDEEEEYHQPDANRSRECRYNGRNDTLFETLDEAQAWHVFCINPNNSQLPNQLEGRTVKGQVRSFGLAEITKRCGVLFEVNMMPEEFCERYGEGMAEVGVMEGTEKERVQQARTAFGLENMDIVLGNQQRLSTSSKINFVHGMSKNKSATACGMQRQRQNSVLVLSLARMLPTILLISTSPRVMILGQPATAMPSTPPANNSLPVNNASPFIRADQYDDEYHENLSRMTSQQDDSASNFGFESYAPSRNMFHNAEKAGLANKEALPGEVQEGETTEDVKESSARRRWVALCWILTWWLHNPCLTYNRSHEAVRRPTGLEGEASVEHHDLVRM